MSVSLKEIETNETPYANPYYAYADACDRSKNDFDSCPALQTPQHATNISVAETVGEGFFAKKSTYITHRKNTRKNVSHPFTVIKFDKVNWPVNKTKQQLVDALAATLPNIKIELVWAKNTCSWLIRVYC